MRSLRTWALKLLDGFESQLYHSLAVQPRASYLTSLCFSLLLCEINMIIVLTLEAVLMS